mgnify:CR=1 FL=1
MTDLQIVTADDPGVLSLGSVHMADYGAVIAHGTKVADLLRQLINDRKLSSNIGGREYVTVEGWNALGAMLGVTPREVGVREVDGDYEAEVELIRLSDGAVIGRATAIVGSDEKTWSSRPRYARRSMAVTRATGKAFRLALSWIVKLAGFEVTPAEEMPDESPVKSRFGDNGTTDKRLKTEALYNALAQEAAAHEIEAEPVEAFETLEDLIRAGKELRAALDKKTSKNGVK